MHPFVSILGLEGHPKIDQNLRFLEVFGFTLFLISSQMAERSKAPANSPREKGGVGSKPPPAEKLFFALYFFFYYIVY